MNRLLPFLGLAVCVSVLACTPKRSPDSIADADPFTVAVAIEELHVSIVEGSRAPRWLARFEGTEAVEIELVIPPERPDVPFAFTTGSFHRRSSAGSARLLEAVAAALGASTPPRCQDVSAQLNFDAVILGRNLSRESGEGEYAGGFATDPSGSWLTIKVFVAGGEGEFFLNIDRGSPRGEITIKDSEYGDVVVKELSTVLCPETGV